MSWLSKVGVCLLPLCVCANAVAQRFTFGDPSAGTNARIEVHSVMARSSALGSVEVRLSIPGIDVERQADGFDVLSAGGLAPLQQPGSPELLTTGELIAVPEGFEPRVTVLESEQQEISDVLIHPTQRHYRCGAGTLETFFFNSALYESKKVYPAANVELQEVGRLQDLRLVRVALQPFQMDMANRSLKVTTEMSVRVDFDQVKRAAPVRLSPAFYQLARTVTSNGMELGPFLVADSGPDIMLIVTADSLKTGLDPLVAWKQARGIEVDVVTFSQAGGTNQKVKDYIQNYYNTNKPSYLVFVGNKDTMPPFMETTSSGNAASDWRYALMNGSDRIPNMLYGRIVADSAAEASTQVARWIAYEKTPESGNWFQNALTVASNASSPSLGPTDVQYVQQIETVLKAHTYKAVDEFYQGTQTATSANISRGVNQGRTWIAYVGHGSGTSWASTNDNFSTQQIDQLTNANHLPILIDVACENASWVSLPRCFGKAWVTHTAAGAPAGAVGYYGGSVSISWDPPAIMSVGVAKYHFEKPVQTLGGSVLAGQMYLIEKMGSTDDTLDNMKWYNLFGDPSLLIRTDVPHPYNVNLVNADKDSVQVAVTDASGNAVADVQAALTAADSSLLATGKTDAAGRATLAVSATISSLAGTTLTTSGYNLETHQVLMQ